MKRILLGIFLAGFLLPVLVWLLHPWPIFVLTDDPSSSSYMKQRIEEAEERGETLEIRHRWVPLREMSPDLVRAVLVGEDRRFLEHRGVDWEALAEEVHYQGEIPFRITSREDREAFLEAWRFAREHREEVRGRSTITQQLARNLYLSDERSFIRKAQELLLARRLELFLSKDRILELYLNLAEWGPGIFGAGAASEHYFGCPPSELTRRQAAALAATLPHPLTSNPAHRPGRMAWRRDLILERMGGSERPVPPPVAAPDPAKIIPPPAPRVGGPDLPAPGVMRDSLPGPPPDPERFPTPFPTPPP